jgi:hypothetical protein
MAVIGFGFTISAYFVKPANKKFGDPLPENSGYQE